MAESELLKASRDLAWRQFMNGVVLQSMAHHRTCRGYVRENVQQGNSKIVLVTGLIELVFWVVVAIVLGGTFLMSLCGLIMIVFNID